MTKIVLFLLAVCLYGQTQSLEKIDIIVSMKGGINGALDKIKNKSFTTRVEKIQAVHDALINNRDLSQNRILSLLDSEGVYHRSLHISNEIYIPKANSKLIQKLKALPEVSNIRLDEKIPLLVSSEVNEPTTNAEWGVERIQAPEAWAAGWTGKGATVGIIDTGARYTHEAIAENYVGTENHGWRNPYENTENPEDEIGLGTFSTAIIAGSLETGVGIAPDARWIACKGCEFSCLQSAILTCSQFMLCPTDFQGNFPNCSLSPHVVSNSWGTGIGATWFDSALQAWLMADIIGVFPVGNSGSCSSAGYPANSLLALGIGSTGPDDTPASSNSKGPINGNIKPDLLAPGLNIRSAHSDSDSAYATYSGTSMASAHIVGTLALMYGKNESLTVSEAVSILFETAENPLPNTGQNCGGVDENDYPNNVHGWGRVNAFKAAQLA